jgi:hypothetical protein
MRKSKRLVFDSFHLGVAIRGSLRRTAKLISLKVALERRDCLRALLIAPRADGEHRLPISLAWGLRAISRPGLHYKGACSLHQFLTFRQRGRKGWRALPEARGFMNSYGSGGRRVNCAPMVGLFIRRQSNQGNSSAASAVSACIKL